MDMTRDPESYTCVSLPWAISRSSCCPDNYRFIYHVTRLPHSLISYFLIKKNQLRLKGIKIIDVFFSLWKRNYYWITWHVRPKKKSNQIFIFVFRNIIFEKISQNIFKKYFFFQTIILKYKLIDKFRVSIATAFFFYQSLS